MKYIDGFRDPDSAKYICENINHLGEKLKEENKVVRIMEVCGSHTMAIARFGIRGMLHKNIKLISGPGCPVCVTSAGFVDSAIELSKKGIIIATFGDMLKVPGKNSTLAKCRAEGASIEVCYSPVGAAEIAEKNPDREVVFLSIGFETTIPSIMGLLAEIIKNKIKNISLLSAFKLVPPALYGLMYDPSVNVDGFLCPAHVSAIIGSDAYVPFSEEFSTSCVVAGFEPLDILFGLEEIIKQQVTKTPRVVNQYDRVVKQCGNKLALKVINKYLKPVDSYWRGIGVISESGLGLKEKYGKYDAEQRHNIKIINEDNSKCRCGEVLKGIISPVECTLFKSGCTPSNPVGACMVSSEGSCAAYYKYCDIDCKR